MAAGRWDTELALDRDLRRQLGLSPDETLRLQELSERFVLLARGGDRPLAAPWDRSLVLSADVRSFPLADLFSMIHDAGKSGFLAFDWNPDAEANPKDLASRGDSGAGESREKVIYFARGEIVFAASSDPADRLGHSLLRSGKLKLSQLRDAQRAWSAPDRLGKVLVERGLLSPGELWNAVKHQVEEIVRSLFAHTQGRVYFWEGEVEPDNVVRLVLPTQRLVSEGLRRRDEIFLLLAKLEDRRVEVRALSEEARRLTGNERALHEALQTVPSFPHACRSAGLDPLTGARVVQLLSLLGAVRIERSGDDRALGESAEDALRELVADHVKLLAELVAPLVAVDGADPVAERVGAVIRDGAEQFPELFGGLTIGPGAVLDPEELVERALRLAGDRASQVSRALGELVAYVEFDLMNHPEIEDPQQFLEALESLRASIR